MENNIEKSGLESVYTAYGNISPSKYMAYYNDISFRQYRFDLNKENYTKLVKYLDENFTPIFRLNDNRVLDKAQKYNYNQVRCDSYGYECTGFNYRNVYSDINKSIFIDTINSDKPEIEIVSLFDNPKCDELLNIINTQFKYLKDNSKTPNFYQIGMGNMGDPVLFNLPLKDVKLNSLYYNDDININAIANIINSDKSGLILFSGIAGSGKSSLIKYLSNKTDKKFCNLPNESLNILNSPNYLGFLIHNLKDSVIIIEDCEKMLASRKSIRNEYISTILNIGDGLLGNALNLKIILTFNSEDNIDPAILRKGRTLYMHRFGKLSPENATFVSNDIGNNIIYTEPMALCDIFNISDNGVEAKAVKMGFK